MIEVNRAISLERVIQEGTRNKPWIVSVKTSNGLKPYVAKIFAQNDIDQKNALCREVYATVLARELELNVPDSCLIEFPADFRSSLSETGKVTLKQRHDRYAFGTEYLEGATTYSPSLNTKDFEPYEIESIYAFDVVINNFDRTPRKPNILLYDRTYYLIDHELSLVYTDVPNSDKNLSLYPFWNHIFHTPLKSKSQYNTDKPDFEGFLESFRIMNLRKLTQCARQLEQLKYITDDAHVISKYFDSLRNKPGKLGTYLKASIK